METITMFPVVSDRPIPPTGVFYRPFDYPALERWVKKSRERFGIELLSRKQGLHMALKYLQSRKGCVAVLYDQNAGGAGLRSLFFERLCSTSGLPGVLVEGTKCDVGIFYARRTGFWRSEVLCEKFDSSDAVDITIRGNIWLERKLREDEGARFDWLWLHRRWKINNEEKSCFRLQDKRGILPETLKYMGLSELPRKLKVFVSAPDSMSSVLSLLPFLRTLRESRPDARVCLICDARVSFLARAFQIVDEVVSSPSECAARGERVGFFRYMGEFYPDYFLNLRFGNIADAEERALKAEYSFSIETESSRRLAKRKLKISDSEFFGETEKRIRERFFRNFGMVGEVDFSPLKMAGDSAGLVSGSRKYALLVGDGRGMALDEWRKVVHSINAAVDGAEFLIVSDTDEYAYSIVKDFEHVEAEILRSGSEVFKTARKLTECFVAIASDFEFASLANALGIKVVALFEKGLSFDGEVVRVEATSEGILNEILKQER